MEIYKYLNSKDVADYLKKIDYQFSSLEMAWIIWHNVSISLSEKHTLWKQLVKTTDDCEIKAERQLHHYDSLHRYLLDCINVQNKVLEIFANSEVCGAVYSFICKRYDTNNKTTNEETDDTEYSSLSDCWDKAIKYTSNDNSFQSISITCKYVNEANKCIRVTYNKKHEIMSVYDRGIIDYNTEQWPEEVFDYVWFKWPMPFKKGDVVIDCTTKNLWGFCMGPFVLDEIATEWTNQWLEENADSTDMCSSGYFVGEDGDVYKECTDNYVDLEYYKEPLVNNLRTLKCISNYLKEKISLDEALKYYHTILLEENYKSYKNCLGFTNEGLKLGGIINEK